MKLTKEEQVDLMVLLRHVSLLPERFQRDTELISSLKNITKKLLDDVERGIYPDKA